MNSKNSIQLTRNSIFIDSIQLQIQEDVVVPCAYKYNPKGYRLRLHRSTSTTQLKSFS